MAHYVGEKINKPLDTNEKLKQYASMAEYCNSNGYYMKENANDYEIAEFPAPTFPELKQRKKAQIASDRYNFETSGIGFGSSTIKTDRESVALLKGAYDEAVANPNYTVNWKAEEGFVTLNAEQIKTVYQRVRAHVQSAFDAEMALVAQIDAATTEAELDAIVWRDPN